MTKKQVKKEEIEVQPEGAKEEIEEVEEVQQEKKKET
jgi:hypothetical protein